MEGDTPPVAPDSAIHTSVVSPTAAAVPAAAMGATEASEPISPHSPPEQSPSEAVSGVHAVVSSAATQIGRAHV